MTNQNHDESSRRWIRSYADFDSSEEANVGRFYVDRNFLLFWTCHALCHVLFVFLHYLLLHSSLICDVLRDRSRNSRSRRKNVPYNKLILSKIWIININLLIYLYAVGIGFVECHFGETMHPIFRLIWSKRATWILAIITL